MRKHKLLLLLVPAVLSGITLVISCQKKNLEALTAAGNAASPRLTTNTVSQLTIASATTNAPADVGNYPASYAIDNNYTTHWSGKTDTGDSTSITFDLGALKSVSSVKISFATGGSTTRTSNFDVAISQDGLTGWVTTVYRKNCAPNTTALQTFSFSPTNGRYVRIIGHGNNTAPPGNIWNSYNEVQIFGDVPVASTASKIWRYGELTNATKTVAGSPSSNVADSTLSTLWSGQQTSSTDSSTLGMNLDNVYSLEYIKIAFSYGSDPARKTRFSIYVSTDSLTWTRVIANSSSTPHNTALETFDFPNINAQYIKLVGYGNTSVTNAMFTSITEIEPWGKPLGSIGVIGDYETNDLSQWEEVKVTNPGNIPYSILLTSSPDIRQGAHGAKFMVHAHDTIPGFGHRTERAEVSMWRFHSNYTLEKTGDDFYYGWSTKFDTGWTAPVGWGIIAQWQTTFACCNPDMVFNAGGDNLSVLFDTGTSYSYTIAGQLKGHYTFGTQPGTAPYDPKAAASYQILSTLSKGKWHDFIVHIKFAADSTGVMQVWHRLQGATKFTQVMNYLTVPTKKWTAVPGDIPSDTSYRNPVVKSGVSGYSDRNYYRQGLYRDSTNATNVLWHDGFVRGSSYSAVRARFR